MGRDIGGDCGRMRTVTNAPAVGQLYGMPNDMRYAFSDFERERINAQGVVQFAPSDALTLTLDYTFASNEIAENRGEQTIWLQRNNSFTDLTFDTGEEVATPIFLTRSGRRQGLRLRAATQQAEERAEFDRVQCRLAGDGQLHPGAGRS